MRCLALALVMICSALSTGVQAQERWLPLGGASYSLDEQRAVIPVDRDKRFLRAVRLEILRGQVDIIAVRAVFLNGTTEVISGRQVLASGGEVVLRIQAREPLREFYINYIPRGNVQMSLEGAMRGDVVGGGVSGGQDGGNSSWVELGCKAVGYLVDRDSLSISSPETYRALRLSAQGNDIEMIELRVLYDGGRRDSLDSRFVVRSGQRSRAIELGSDRRRIAKIEMIYRQRPGFAGKTRLCFDGLRLQ